MVVVASGARLHRPLLELANDPVVLDAWDVIGGPVEPPGDIVVADFRFDWVGLGVAEMLALRGHRVTLASNGCVAGFRIQQYVRDTMMAAALRAHMTLVPLTRLFGYAGSAVILQHVLTEEPVIIENVTALVLAQGHEPVADLLADLADYDGDVVAVGDCLAPRTVEEAVLEGLRAGVAI